MPGGYLKEVEIIECEYSSERDSIASKLVAEGKLVRCGFSGFGYPTVFVYQVSETK